MRPSLALMLASVILASIPADSAVPWGLDRIDQRSLPLDGRFNPAGDGAGVHAYVIDTGVRRTHQDFGGRADWVGDFVSGTSDQPGSPEAGECDPASQHGTHVASILAGRTFGVARAARVHSRRILPCTGTTRTDHDATVRAVNWITAHGVKPAVVNISPGSMADSRPIARRGDHRVHPRGVRLRAVRRRDRQSRRVHTPARA